MCQSTENPSCFESGDKVSILTFTLMVSVMQFKSHYLSEPQFHLNTMMSTLQEDWEGTLQSLNDLKNVKGALPKP